LSDRKKDNNDSNEWNYAMQNCSKFLKLCVENCINSYPSDFLKGAKYNVYFKQQCTMQCIDQLGCAEYKNKMWKLYGTFPY
jgi:hypothetical protein